MTWRDDAACKGRDPDLWFPLTSGPGTGLEAREVCAVCPVRVACLAWAMEHEPEGIWGGLSAAQRARKMTPARALELARQPVENRRLVKQQRDRRRRKKLTDEQKAAKAEYLARYRELNRARANAYRKAYYRNNKERTLEVNERWRKANPERRAEYDRRYRENQAGEVA